MWSLVIKLRRIDGTLDAILYVVAGSLAALLKRAAFPREGRKYHLRLQSCHLRHSSCLGGAAERRWALGLCPSRPIMCPGKNSLDQVSAQSVGAGLHVGGAHSLPFRLSFSSLSLSSAQAKGSKVHYG